MGAPGIVWDDEAAPQASAQGGGIQWDDHATIPDEPSIHRNIDSERPVRPLSALLTSSLSAGSLVGAPRVLAFEDALRRTGRGEGEGFWDHYARQRDAYLAGQDKMESGAELASAAGKVINPQLLAGPLAAGTSGLASAAAPTLGTLMKQSAVQAGAAALGQGDADLTKGEFGKAALQTGGSAALGAATTAALASGIPAVSKVAAKVIPAAKTAASVAREAAYIAAPFSGTARFATAVSRAAQRLAPEAQSAAQTAVAEEAPTLASRISGLLKRTKPSKVIDPFGLKYTYSPAAGGIDELASKAPAAATAAAKKVSVFDKVKYLVKSGEPGTMDNPSFSSFINVLRGAMSKDEAEGSDENLKKAHYTLSQSNPDYQQFVKEASGE